MTGTRPIRRALLAVSDKRGLAELAERRGPNGRRARASGGTAPALRRGRSRGDRRSRQVTGSPEMLDGRVKTLHPAIHAGLLADRRNPEHVRELEAHGIEPFDLVVVDLYPFRETVAAGAGSTR